MRFKPLRASSESGMFSSMVQLRAGVDLGPVVHLGAVDLMVLSGLIRYTEGPLASLL